jgi:hypothetical protein
MKRFIFFLLTVFSVSQLFAQLNGDGFYRIKNYGTGHYIWVCDNTGKINYAATTADMGALQLWPELDMAISEPASVLYMKHAEGEKWDAQAQGTGVVKMIQHHLQIRTLGVVDGNTLYQVYATESGMTIYLSDAGGWGGDYHTLGTTGKGTATRWIAEPISANTDNYFGVKPIVAVGNKYYAPFYADFAFSFASAGMKAYTVSAIDNGIAVIKPIETEVIPASTPVIIECLSADKSNNRLNLLAGSYPAVANNKLAGVYFCNEFRNNSKDAITPFDNTLMRVLQVNAEGKLVFDTQTTNLHVNWWGDDGKRYLNANQSYLPVPTGTPEEVTIMTETEYAEYKANLKYTVTFMVDGQVFQTSELKAGETIAPINTPVKEGYTFSGWSEIPDVMPAHDVVVTGSFSVNSYKLTYQVDGADYKTLNVNFGVALTPEQAPAKEGYTFSGWSEIPATMPAHDVVITGTFSINSYKLTYLVDGETYKTIDVAYGTTLSPEQAPEKEGYTFLGWSEIPATMPANDVVITGTFSINSYKLTYFVDGVSFKTIDVVYGTTLSPEQAPEKEGYTFSGWSDVPATMPANDVVITGTFSVNSYKVTFMYGDNVLKTITVEYGAAIPLPTSLDSERYTLVEWLEVPTTMPAHDVTIRANYVDGISMVQNDGKSARRIQLNGISSNTLMKGIHIIRMSDGSTKKVMVK